MMKCAKFQSIGLLFLAVLLNGATPSLAQEKMATEQSRHGIVKEQHFHNQAEVEAFAQQNSDRFIAPNTKESVLKQESEREIVIEEDFSLFTAGSETEPDTVEYPLNYNDGNRYVDNSLTHTPGWIGMGIYQAGGVCFLGSPIIGGVINTPEGEYSGDLEITFKARKKSSSRTAIILVNVVNNIWATYANPLTVPTMFNLDTTWQEYTVKTQIDYSGKDACIQFNGATYNDGIFLDDIKVTRGKEFVPTPIAQAASDFQPNSFTARWNQVRNADDYLFSMYKEEPTSDGNLSIEEGFETGAPLPEGWEGEKIQIEEGEGINGTKAVSIGDKGCLITPNNGGRIASFSLSAKAVFPESGDYDICYAYVDGFDGREWIDLNLSIPIEEEEYLSTFIIDEENLYGLAEQLYQLRIRIDTLSGLEAVFFDNIEYVTTPSTKRVSIFEDKVVADTFFTYNEMDDISDYYYSVKSRNSHMESPASNLIYAYGVAAPKVGEASDIDSNGPYTANWESVARATEYNVYTYERQTLESDKEGAIVYHDDFSKVTSEATPSEPEYLANFEPMGLDEYTSSCGWKGIDVVLANGHLGFGGYGEIISPFFDLSGNGGRYSVTIKLYCTYEGDNIVVQGLSQYKTARVNQGEQTVTLDFSDGTSKSTIWLYAQYGATDIVIDEITVQQDLKAGDHIYTPVAISGNLAKENLSFRFEDFFRDEPETEYVYRVFSYLDKFIINQYWSDASEATVINYNGPDTTDTPECPTPTNLRVEDITANSARLLWDADAENTAFNLRFRQADASEWNNVSDLTENEYALTDLDDNTAYVWTVMAACSEGRYSGWATENEFTTQDVANEGLDKAGLFVTTGENRINIMNPSALNIDRVRVYTLSGSLAHDFAIRSNGNVLLTTDLSMQVAVVEVLADGQVFRFKTLIP